MLTAALAIVVGSVTLVLWVLYSRRPIFLSSRLYTESFSLWLKQIVMGEEIEIPSPEDQKDILSRKLVKSVIKGETWYLINAKWLKSLKDFIGITPSGTYDISQPGPIDNRPILTEDLSDLRKGLAEKVEYELISEEVWNHLKTWYGMYPDQIPIARKAISLGENYVTVEVYLMELKCYKNFEMDTEVKILVSKADMISTIHHNLRNKFSVPENTSSRLWMSYSGDKYDLLNLDQSIQESGICNSNQSVVIEVQCGGTWPKNGRSKLISNTNAMYAQASTSKNGGAFRSHTTSISLRPSRQTSTIHCNNPIKLPGVCGLNNLGNTCYMNSVIQCLSNAPPLTEYFVNKQYLYDLNTTNPLGMKGEIAKAYGDLIQIIWSGRFSCTNPVHFKVQVGKFNPQLCGCLQHDAQELLIFLLDGLHEDLNRILKKPYIVCKDYSGEEDHIVASESWANYKKRNDSVIVDTFHGVLKSRVVCPQCERLSVTFDPFCSLSLPLPLKKDRYLKIRFIPFDPTLRECLYRVMVPRRGVVRDLCQEVGAKTMTEPSLLVVAEINNSHFHKFYSHEEYIDQIDDKDTIFIYEINEDSKNSLFILPVCFWEMCEPNESFQYNHLFGIPILVFLEKDDLTIEKIRTRLLFHMRRHFNLPDSLTDDKVLNSNMVYIPSLFLLDSGVISNSNPLRLEFDKSGEFLNLNEILQVNDSERIFGRKILLVQLSAEERREYFCETSPDCNSDMTVSRSASKEVGKISIYDCLDLFTTCEKLGIENAWYCPNCKEHKIATKKLDLWKLPRVLIIHLKRFSYTRSGDKIDTLVEFPIHDLNLFKYIINGDHQHISYNLIGVINHYGTMSGGHYTAYCFNKDSQSWFYFDDNTVAPVNIEEIMSPSAYVLFYLRNDNTSPIDSPMDID